MARTQTTNTTFDDRAIVEALLRRDPFVTRLFFYRNCRPLFISLINRLSTETQRWEYDEVVNEIYTLLMEDDGRRLRTFTFSCSLYQWLKVVAMRHLTAHTERVVIDSESKEPLLQQESDSAETSSARMDVERLLSMMPNQRYVEVIRKLMLEGYDSEELARDMGIRVSNLYNIKRRAMAQLTEVAQKDKKHYGTGLS